MESEPADEVRRDLIVMGASAGGVEALRCVVAGFAPDLPAAICVVLHLSSGTPSALAGILGRAGQLPCRTARDGDRLEPGTILVAPPDRHLVIDDGHVRLSVGPRENKACLSGASEREELVLDAINRRGKPFRCGVVVLPLRAPQGINGAILMMEARS